ncbi:MAG: biotin transporter BioY, partial [Candidatus Verstraetearchaeota archaeon]|nr:biotin transporter BioY [Candidatus Verstraetearchaeota archaeon]
MDMLSGTSKAKTISLAAVFAAMMAAGGIVSIPFPFSPVPMSLQTLFLYLSVLLLKKRAVLSQAVYLTMGIAGLPVFAKGMAGYSVLIGPTGGFLFGFLLSSALAGYALSVLGRGWFARAAAVVLAMSTVFLLGWIWLAFWM